MVDFGDPRPVLDYQGERDERTWVMREKVLNDEVGWLREEVAYLREMLRLALVSNTGKEQS